jgi:hypothetical protein
MTSASPSVDELAPLCTALACNEVCEIMEEIKTSDLTACEIVALLTVLRPAWERRQARQRNPASVLQLVKPVERTESH